MIMIVSAARNRKTSSSFTERGLSFNVGRLQRARTACARVKEIRRWTDDLVKEDESCFKEDDFKKGEGLTFGLLNFISQVTRLNFFLYFLLNRMVFVKSRKVLNASEVCFSKKPDSIALILLLILIKTFGSMRCNFLHRYLIKKM